MFPKHDFLFLTEEAKEKIIFYYEAGTKKILPYCFNCLEKECKKAKLSLRLVEENISKPTKKICIKTNRHDENMVENIDQYERYLEEEEKAETKRYLTSSPMPSINNVFQLDNKPSSICLRPISMPAYEDRSGGYKLLVSWEPKEKEGRRGNKNKITKVYNIEYRRYIPEVIRYSMIALLVVIASPILVIILIKITRPIGNAIKIKAIAIVKKMDITKNITRIRNKMEKSYRDKKRRRVIEETKMKMRKKRSYGQYRIRFKKNLRSFKR